MGERDGDDIFGIRVGRDRLFGLWAAKQLGLEGGNALAYAAEVTAADAEGGEQGMIAKVTSDLAREEVPVDSGAVETQLRECEQQARHRRPS